jgi:DNA gyrase subunit B
LKAVGQSKRGHTGTSVTFWPDPEVFEEVEFRYATIAERLQVMAFLNRGLTIALTDERPGHKQSETFAFDGGIVDFVRHLNQSKEPLFKDVGYFGDKGPEGEVEVAWQWNTGYHEGLHSFANGISTTEGGMHVEGFRRALTQAVNRYAKDRDRLGAARRSAVRGPDEGEAGQHRDAIARRAGDEHASHAVARGAPEPGQGDRHEGR